MSFRPELCPLEDRVTPANTTWVGSGMGNGALWSVAANWSNGIPGPTDVAILDGTPGIGANTNSTMDLGGVGAYHVGKLVMKAGYNSTITLGTANLVLDILDIRSAGTIKGTKHLVINQSTNGMPFPAATMFGTSFWKDGTLEVASVTVFGENAHRMAFDISPEGSVNLNSNLSINNESTVTWTSGAINVLKGKTVTNSGTFFAESPGGTMGNTGGAADSWTFTNFSTAIGVRGKLKNAKFENKGLGAELEKPKKVDMEEDLFEIEGEFIQDADALVIVEGGTLKITGTVTQSAGSVTIADGATLEVTEDYDFSGGSVAVNGDGDDTFLKVGTFSQSGGDAMITGATLDSDGATTISGGSLTLAPTSMGSVVGALDSGGNVTIQSGGTLRGVGNVSTGTLVNSGTIAVGGVYNPPYANPVGTLAVTGNYTQASGGVLVLKIASISDYDRLAVSGLATLAGTLNVTPLQGEPEVVLQGPLDVFEVVTYGSRSGTFGTVNLPPLASPTYWEGYIYDHPDHPHSLSLWAVTGAR
jgi:hypothetical protein